MNGLVTIIETRAQYEIEYDNNSAKMQELFDVIFPEINVPVQYVYQILKYLEETSVNAAILPRVIRGVNNILLGTKSGQVIVHIKDNLMNVSVREQDSELPTKMSK